MTMNTNIIPPQTRLSTKNLMKIIDGHLEKEYKEQIIKIKKKTL